MTFFTRIGSDNPANRETAVQAVFISDVEFTSALIVNPYQRVNVGIMIGSQVSDILSAGAFSDTWPGATISGIVSTASMVITLQRQYPEELGTDFWHDVDTWSVTIAEGEGASSENISALSEPETMMYRAGVKTNEYESGLALVRLGTP